jgi:protein TonB
LAAALAAALHIAFFASGRFLPPAPLPKADPISTGESTEGATIPLALGHDDPVSAPDDMDAELEPVVDEAATPTAVTIVPLDLQLFRAGALSFSFSRLVPTLGGRGGGFRLESSALGKVGRCTALPVFELAELDQPPVIVAQPLPSYPPSLLRTGVSGDVLVCFVVGVDGIVRMARVLQSTHPEFAVPALQAVARWKFRPGRKDGRAVATRVEAPIAFAVPEKRG